MDDPYWHEGEDEDGLNNHMSLRAISDQALLQMFVDSAQAVIDNWEHGHLAVAVHRLELVLGAAKLEGYHPQKKRKPTSP